MELRLPSYNVAAADSDKHVHAYVTCATGFEQERVAVIPEEHSVIAEFVDRRHLSP